MTELALIGAPTLLLWGDADTLVSRKMQDHSHARSAMPSSSSTQTSGMRRAGKTRCGSAATS
jgi:pimeloyl-ACP methyl ester carboxylesterase